MKKVGKANFSAACSARGMAIFKLRHFPLNRWIGTRAESGLSSLCKTMHLDGDSALL
jgi:hypothetical protein